jgi:hypothetical protein
LAAWVSTSVSKRPIWLAEACMGHLVSSPER